MSRTGANWSDPRKMRGIFHGIRWILGDSWDFMGCIGIGISPQSNMAIGKSQGFELGRSTRKTIGFPSHVSGGHRRKHLRDQTPFFWPSLRITIAGKGTVKIYTEYRISSLKKRTMFEAECFD